MRENHQLKCDLENSNMTTLAGTPGFAWVLEQGTEI